MKGARTSDYDFTLPDGLIAQEPLPERTASRLMVVKRDTGAIDHAHFGDLADLIPAGDVLALNTTRVMKARLLGTRASGAPAEILLLKPAGGDTWEAMVAPGGKLKRGRRVDIAPGFSVEILEITERRTRIVRLLTTVPHDVAIERYGHVPLPPYIARADDPSDSTRYQTVYARDGAGRSVAAPTAGLHFTRELLDRLAARGVERAEVILHVGAGTFKPVESDDPAGHVMHEEWYEVSQATADALAAAQRRGGRVWAVGTTTVRALESAADAAGSVRATQADTRLFIRTPYTFRTVDRMLTNFHLPRSTLLMLVAAFGGYELIMRAYREAMAHRYRFFSYGDAMVIL